MYKLELTEREKEIIECALSYHVDIINESNKKDKMEYTLRRNKEDMDIINKITDKILEEECRIVNERKQFNGVII